MSCSSARRFKESVKGQDVIVVPVWRLVSWFFGFRKKAYMD